MVVLKILKKDKEDLLLEVVSFINVGNMVIRARNEILSGDTTFSSWSSWNEKAPISEWKKYFRVLQNKEIKLYESINEKFTEDSDPVSDLRIGIDREFLKKEFQRLQRMYFYDVFKEYFSESDAQYSRILAQSIMDIISVIADDHPPLPQLSPQTIFNRVCVNHHIRKEVAKVLRKNFNIRVDPEIYESVNEKFEENSDSIYDMGIGIPSLLKDCVERMFDIDKQKNLLTTMVEDMGNINHIRIYKDIFRFDFYNNSYIKNFDKVKYAIYLLKEVGIYHLLEEEYKQDGYKDHLDIYLFFKIKPKFVKYFPRGWYDEMAYVDNDEYKHRINDDGKKIIT